jgi:hypothetical protein
MRPRFSIRLLLVAVFVVSLACYVSFVRPVVFAEQFMRAFEAEDFTAAESLCCDSSNQFLTESMNDGRTYSVEVKVFPRKWRDVWKLRQPMVVSVIPEPSSPGSKDLVGYQVDVIATITGIRPGELYAVTFKR